MTLPVVQITVHEVEPGRDDLLDALTQVRNETITDINPDDPPAPRAEIEAEVFAATTQMHVRSWVAFVDGEPAGEATFDLEDDDDNAHIAESDWLAVCHRHRRRGVANALMRRALGDLAADGRTSLILWVPVLDPDLGGTYAQRLGLVRAHEERCSRLRIDDLDDDLVDRWVSDGRVRSDGYRMVHFGDRCPDEHLAPYLEATRAMDDMPIDDLDWVVAPTDEALVRSHEEVWAAKALTVFRSMVVAPSGAGAGFTELYVSRHRPTMAWQGDTGVVPGHRGHGLGRWLKAENLRLAQRDAPGFRTVETYNAESNPWMLDINVAMGFRPHVTFRAHQGDLVTARASLG